MTAGEVAKALERLIKGDVRMPALAVLCDEGDPETHRGFVSVRSADRTVALLAQGPEAWRCVDCLGGDIALGLTTAKACADAVDAVLARQAPDVGKPPPPRNRKPVTP